LTINQTGIRGFCAEEDAVVRVDPAGAANDTLRERIERLEKAAASTQ